MSEYIASLVQKGYDQGKALLENYGVIQKPVQPNTHDAIRDFITNHPYITTSIVTSTLYSTAKFAIGQLKKRVAANTILEIDLEDVEFTPQPVAPSLSQILSPGKFKMNYLTFIQTLKAANQNPKISGLILYLPGSSHNPFEGLALAHIYEMRKALFEFKGQKIAHADMFNSSISYYFATACDKIFMTDNGLLILNGFQLRNFFFKQLLDKIEVEPFVVKRAEYKSAMNPFTEEKYTEHHREQVETLAKELFDTFVSDIAQTREKNAESVREWFDIGIFGPKDSVEHKVIDGVKYRDELLGVMAQSLSVDSKKLNLLYLQKYIEQKLDGSPLDKINPKKKDDNLVAVIYASGAIVRGRPSNPRDTNMNSNVIVDAIYKARKDKEVKVILIRVDSPGGEVSASEVIRREIELARTEDKKKVVISMGGLAASGGYWISLPGDKIVCNPFTITGSIGVIMGKLYLGDFFSKKLGVTNDSVSTSKNAGLLSQFERANDQQMEIFNNLADDFYDSFLEKVSERRNISKDDLKNNIAKGKVYLGNSAKALNLVDSVGDFYDALQVAKELAGMKNEPHIVVFHPKKKSVVESLLNTQSPSNSKERALKSNVSIFEPFTSLYQSICGFMKLTNIFIKHQNIIEKYAKVIEKTQAVNGQVRSELDINVEL